MTNICKICKLQSLLGKHGPAKRFLRHKVTLNTVDFQEEDTHLDFDYQNAKPFREIPGPKGLPYFGTLFQYRKGPFHVDKFHEALLNRYREFGPIFKETIAGETIVHLFDPEYIKIVYQSDGKIPHIPPLLETTQRYREYRGLSPGLGNTNGEEWYRLRSAVQQMMMRPKAVSMYLPQVNEVADDLMGRLQVIRDDKTQQIPEFYNEILKWSLESSGMTCFESRLGCLNAGVDSHQQRMINANAAIFKHSLQLQFSIPIYKYIHTPTWKRLVAAEDYFFGNGQKLVDETIQKIQQSIDNGNLQDGQYAFLTYLLGKQELTYKDLSIITLSLFADGLSTTVPTLVGQLYCIAANPVTQEKLREEVLAITKADENITSEMINKMPYMKACVKEGFRFFPIGVEVSRIPQKNLVIGGYQIPAGTNVQLNNNMLLQLPEYFENPKSYVPERWVRGAENQQSIHPYLLIPFGHGPRMCAGRRFAEQEMFVIIAKLLQKFRLSWPHSDPMQQKYNLLLTPDKPPDFKFTLL